MSPIVRRVALSACALLVVLNFSACAGQESEPQRGEPPVENGAENGQPPAASSPAELTQEKCSQCHTFERVEQAEKSRPEWEQTVDRMISNGLTVTDEEKQAIIDYLAERDAQ